MDCRILETKQDTHVAVLVTDGYDNQGRKCECYHFTCKHNQTEKNEKQEDIAATPQEVPVLIPEAIPFERTARAESSDSNSIESKQRGEEEADLQSLLTVERSKTIRNIAIVLSISSIAMAIITAMAITPLVVLQPGSVVILHGFTLNIAMLATGTGGFGSVTILIAISSVLWVTDWLKERYHRKVIEPAVIQAIQSKPLR